MYLMKLLEINEALVPPEARKSLSLAERVWVEAGEPTERWALTRVLEEILVRCIASRIWYAPILLQRKKAIERGTWRPKTPAQPAGNSAHAAITPTPGMHPALAALLAKQPLPTMPRATGPLFAPPAEKQLPRACPHCQGTALIVYPDGFRGVCTKCDAWSTKGLPPELGPVRPPEPAPLDKGKS